MVEATRDEPGPREISRRQLLQAVGLAGGGLLLGGSWLAPAEAAGAAEAASGAAAGTWVNAWVRISPDNTVTLVVSQAEMGQGISTTLPALLADELGAAWPEVRLELAPYAAAYQNPRVRWMFTGNSESVQSFHDHLRTMGAAAREMLIQAAAARWQVEPARCEAVDSQVRLVGTAQSLPFGELAAEAARLPVPASPTLKPRSAQRWIGRSLPRVDVPAKVDGSAVFGIDFDLPGLLHAAVRTAPAVGGSVLPYDAETVRSRPGVRAVVPLPAGVAVVAETWWQAQKALRALELRFEAGPHADLDSARLGAQYQRALEDGPFVTPLREGDVQAELARVGPEGRLRVDYENAFAAHATMEPMNCTAHVTADRCRIWAPTQGQELAFLALKEALGLAADKIAVERTPFLGGGFGRRLLPDFVVQAALISKAVGAPVKVVWDREEDQRRDYFRPATAVRLEAALAANGLPTALVTRVVSPTILRPVFPPIQATLDTARFDPSALEGILEPVYRFEHRQVDFHLLETPLPTSVMRTTGYGPNLFALESFVDELAVRAKADPVAYRRRLLAHDPRALAVLDRAAKLGRWGEPMAKGVGRGVAIARAFGTYLAQVVELAVVGTEVRLQRIVSVVDCGRTLDPGIARAGIEGGVVFGLAYCKAEVTFDRGAVVEDNLDRYVLPYLAETPELVTEFLESDGPLGGVGEVSPVTVPPALANAIFGATGRRLRSLPLARHGLELGPAASPPLERSSS